tara:strand:- start:831 stop:1349 length:519 start_codon:yes stop_codon:yes gene_type:complete
MGKKFEDKTKFGKFLSKAKDRSIDVFQAVKLAKEKDFIGAFTEIKSALSKDPNNSNDDLISELVKKKREFREDYNQYFEDIKDARDTYEKTDHKIADSIAMRIINYNLWVVLLAVIIEILAVIFIDDKVLIAIISGAIGSITTALLQERQQVINFFFGSSKGSKDKSIILDK